MDTLKLGQTLRTLESAVVLDPRLPVGAYRAVLVVEGRTGKSAPAVLLIKVTRQ